MANPTRIAGREKGDAHGGAAAQSAGSMERSENVLEIRGISKSFPGVRALDDVSLQLRRGEVLALVGENGAGKSTMMKILAGVYAPDMGEIRIDGEPVVIGTVERATELGISLVYQELNLCDNLTVAGNVFIGREPRRGLFHRMLDTEAMERDATEFLGKVGLNLSPSTVLKELSIGSQQLVEIAKALSIRSKIVMFDEPTSSLSERETEKLFSVIADLRSQGVSCIYISHRLGEVNAVADRVVVLRDGKLSGCLEKSEITRDKMIRLMVGRDIEKLYQKNHAVTHEVRLELKDFIVPKRAKHPVNLTVRKGEIVVLAGLVGAGRTELLHTIGGIDRSWGGTITLDGKPLKIEKPLDAIRAGIVLVPEDRKANGLIVNMEVDNNIALPGLQDHLSKNGFVDRVRVSDLAERMVKLLDIRLSRNSQAAESLSGGNQQKVVLGKWLSMSPSLLLLDEPTRGIDIGAKAEIYKLLEDLAKSGAAILVASSEMQEVLGIADRVVVMCEGNIAGELNPHACTEEEVMQLATEKRA